MRQSKIYQTNKLLLQNKTTNLNFKLKNNELIHNYNYYFIQKKFNQTLKTNSIKITKPPSYNPSIEPLKTPQPPPNYKLYDNKDNFPFKNEIKIEFLGTASSTPTRTRSCSSSLLKISGEEIIFDCGEGLTVSAQKNNLKFRNLTSIFLTHLHADHIFGLPSLLDFVWRLNPKKELKIYGPSSFARWVYHSLDIMNLSDKFKLLQTFELDFEISEPPFLPFPTHSLPSNTNQWICIDNENFTIKASRIVHTVNCFGYSIYEKSTQKKIVILGDTANPKSILRYGKGIDLLIHECTYPDEYKRRSIYAGHSTPTMAANFANLIEAKNLIINHIGGRFTENESRISSVVSQIQKIYLKPFFVAFDLSKYSLVSEEEYQNAVNASHLHDDNLLVDKNKKKRRYKKKIDSNIIDYNINLKNENNNNNNNNNNMNNNNDNNINNENDNKEDQKLDNKNKIKKERKVRSAKVKKDDININDNIDNKNVNDGNEKSKKKNENKIENNNKKENNTRKKKERKTDVGDVLNEKL